MEPSANGTGTTVIEMKPTIFKFQDAKTKEVKSMEVEVLDTQIELQEILDGLKKAAEGKFDGEGKPVEVMTHDYYRAIITHYKNKCGIEMSMTAADRFVFEVNKLEAEAKKKQRDFWQDMRDLQSSTASAPSEVDD